MIEENCACNGPVEDPCANNALGCAYVVNRDSVTIPVAQPTSGFTSPVSSDTFEYFDGTNWQPITLPHIFSGCTHCLKFLLGDGGVLYSTSSPPNNYIKAGGVAYNNCAGNVSVNMINDRGFLNGVSVPTTLVTVAGGIRPQFTSYINVNTLAVGDILEVVADITVGGVVVATDVVFRTTMLAVPAGGMPFNINHISFSALDNEGNLLPVSTFSNRYKDLYACNIQVRRTTSFSDGCPDLEDITIISA